MSNTINNKNEMEIIGLNSYTIEKVKIANTDCLHQVLVKVLEREDLANQQKEHLWFIGLDIQDYILCIDTITLGTSDQTLVQPMNVFRNAISRGARYGILAHNHPGGEIKPSEEDIDVTDRLYQCGLILDIPVKDHLVVSLKTYYSFHLCDLMKKIEKSIKYMPNYKLKEQMKKEAEEIRLEAIEEGRIKGLAEGVKSSKFEIASSMKKNGLDTKTISKYTGLTEKEIDSILNNS